MIRYVMVLAVAAVLAALAGGCSSKPKTALTWVDATDQDRQEQDFNQDIAACDFEVTRAFMGATPTGAFWSRRDQRRLFNACMGAKGYRLERRPVAAKG